VPLLFRCRQKPQRFADDGNVTVRTAPFKTMVVLFPSFPRR